MLSEEKKEIEEAVSIILRGIDIESSALILEKAIMDNYIISTGRVNILRIATRQILNFIEEYKNKGYLDVVREKVKANEEISKLQKENEKYKYLYQKALDNTVSSDRENIQLKEQIDLMAEFIFQNIDVEEEICNSAYIECKQETAQDITCINCIKQYFEKLAKEKGE